LTNGSFPYVGTQAIVDSGVAEANWRQAGILDRVLPRDSNPEVRAHFDACGTGPFEFETSVLLFNVRSATVRWTGTCEIGADTKIVRGLMQDVTDLRRLERELTAAQKLESVGRLAAGVAHEINTPVQYVADNVQFMHSSIGDIAAVIAAFHRMQRDLKESGDIDAAIQRATDVEEAVDLPYIMENLPPALISAGDGLKRIATIVRSMKEFAYPDTAQKTAADLNQAIASTLVIASNEFKYIADVSSVPTLIE